MSYDEDRERDPAFEAVDEAGGGESEGFELAEEQLIENASHEGEGGTTRVFEHAGDADEELVDDELYAEADSAVDPNPDDDPNDPDG